MSKRTREERAKKFYQQAIRIEWRIKRQKQMLKILLGRDDDQTTQA